MMFCCWKGNKRDGFEVCPSVEAPNLTVAMTFFLNSLVIDPPIRKEYKGALYAKFPNDPTCWLVFVEGTGPS